MDAWYVKVGTQGRVPGSSQGVTGLPSTEDPDMWTGVSRVSIQKGTTLLLFFPDDLDNQGQYLKGDHHLAFLPR